MVPGLHSGAALGPPEFSGEANRPLYHTIQLKWPFSSCGTGDSGLIGDSGNSRANIDKVNLAVVHTDGVYVMGPEEAAYAVFGSS